MPKFSPPSFTKLSTCHPDLQTLFYEVIKSFDCIILEGFRNEHDQESAFAAGNTQLHYPNGKHNKQPSIAVDVAPYPLNWTNMKRFYWFGGYVLGIAQSMLYQGKMSHAVRWGGDWDGDKNIDDQKLIDLVHYEIII